MTYKELRSLTYPEKIILARKFAKHIIEYHASIREVAQHYNTPKSTVHFYLKKYILKDDVEYGYCFTILEENYQSRGKISNYKKLNNSGRCCDIWK